MKEKFEKYISEIPSELQDKARACKSMKELNEFLAENDVELSEEALEVVSGGGCFSGNDPCPKGGKHDWDHSSYSCAVCRKCGETKGYFT